MIFYDLTRTKLFPVNYIYSLYYKKIKTNLIYNNIKKSIKILLCDRNIVNK